MRTHLFTKKAEQHLAQAKKRLAMALDTQERAARAVELARSEVSEAEYRLSLEREADARSAATAQTPMPDAWATRLAL